MRATIPAIFMLALSGSTAAAQVYPPPSSPTPPAAAAPAPQQSPPPQQTTPPQQSPTPQQATPPRQGGPPRFGLRCQTSQLACNLPQPSRVGLNCVCNSPLGRSNGSVVQ